MEAVTLASSQADSDAIEAIKNHHAGLGAALDLMVESLVKSAVKRDVDDVGRTRSDLIEWFNVELVPHAVAEEEAIYPAAGHIEALQVLVRALVDEHGALLELVIALENTDDIVRSATVATAFRALFDSHRRKEDEHLLPALAADPVVSVVGLLDGMHHLLGGHDQTPDDNPVGDHGHDCACGEVDEDDPELDVRMVPHAIRHATVFGALSAVKAGAGLMLIAPHDPLPLLAQAERMYPEMFTVNYLQRGPDAWRLHFGRVA